MTKLNPTRGSQYPLTAYITLDLANNTVVDTNGVTKQLNEDAVFDAILLPPKSIVVGGVVIVSVASDAATTHTLDIGDADDPDRYTATAVNLKSAGVTALTLTGLNNLVGNNAQFTIVTTGAAATEGMVTVTLEYIVGDRQNETQTS